MGNDDTKIDPPTPEELKAEAEALTESKEDEIRANIIAELDLDETEDADKIEKLVKKEVKHREDLSTAIRQKIKHRDANKGTPAPKDDKKSDDSQDLGKKINDGVLSVLEQRDLDDMDLPDDLKKEIKRIAEVQGISVKAARRDPYIAFKEDEHKKAQKAEDATISNKGNQGGGKKSWSVDVPPDVDMSTEEGRKTYEEWRQWAMKQGA